MTVHKTLTDEDTGDTNTYQLVSKGWVRVISTVMTIKLFLILYLFYALLTTTHEMNNVLRAAKKADQRNQAMAEMIAQRTPIQQWVFAKECTEARARHETCPEVAWFPDGNKYPLIKDDPFGAGLFEPDESSVPTPTPDERLNR